MHKEDRIEKFTFGNATFKNIPKKIKEFIEQSENIQFTLKSDLWYIISGQYKKDNWSQIFRQMSKCDSKELHLWDNNHFQIISQIKHVQFINLFQLDLGKQSLNSVNNKINNIQNLCFINFNCLTTLFLRGNQISQIKSFSKLSVPFLSNFSVSLNPLIQINTLIKSKINSSNLNNLYLQFSLESNSLHQDLSCMIKISSESVKRIWILSNKRIEQVKVQSMLKSRFVGLKFKK